MKAVIPAAGLGTRFLPSTKSMPKEMLPVVDRPIIQYVVEEAVASGLDEILIVTGRGKRAIEDHFDRSFELEHHLKSTGKTEQYDVIRRIGEMATIHYVRQPEPRGLGDAILRAERIIGREPFAVLLGDDILVGRGTAIGQLMDVYNDTGNSCFSAQRVARTEISKYGAIDGEPVAGRKGVYRVRDIIEKPPPEDAPSDLATLGRYVFEPEIFDHLRRGRPGHGGEIQLTDAMASMCRSRPMYAAEFEGTRLDAGHVTGFLEANLVLGLEHKKYGAAIRQLLERVRGRTADGTAPKAQTV